MLYCTISVDNYDRDTQLKTGKETYNTEKSFLALGVKLSYFYYRRHPSQIRLYYYSPMMSGVSKAPWR